ncbi:DUF1178 domain-containing protein [Neorhizobium sp. SOG26]|uniref:DUF1178 family protein n=1 Tax=Neorhizobium sp. SOG26 TaxID=2060726 RepID=UPI000E571FBA|nr:DUF1178 family protein [Neorhizobium sp. SOG26]AXV16451.1 DUF1178 domain-containing protein [Neorhizobium sp. SOG26]
MIKYSLSCENAHQFEGWFSTSADFDSQVKSGFLTCPTCHSASISKTLMSPSVSTARKKEAKREMVMDMARQEAIAKIKQVIAEIKSNAEDVGEKFPEEARKIHYGEADARGIIGQASLVEVKELLEEGIDVAPLPVLPEDAN